MPPSRLQLIAPCTPGRGKVSNLWALGKAHDCFDLEGELQPCCHQLTTAVCMDTWIARHKHWKSYCFLFAECGFPVKTTINRNLSRNFLRRRFGSIATLLVLASLLWVNGSFVVFFAANTLQWIANVLHSWWGKWFEIVGHSERHMTYWLRGFLGRRIGIIATLLVSEQLLFISKNQPGLWRSDPLRQAKLCWLATP